MFDNRRICFCGSGVASQLADSMTVGVVKYDDSLESVEVGCSRLILNHDGLSVAREAVLEQVESRESPD